MSLFNTPILPVRKADSSYRLGRTKLRKINEIVWKRHPVVPNPYTPRARSHRSISGFSATDLKNAFWACPLYPASRNISAFEWEDPETSQKQRYRWTVLPQGFTESPDLFGQVLEQILEQFQYPQGVLLLQYVNDLLLSGQDNTVVKEATNKLLNFLGKQCLRESKNKLQYVEREVKILGHLVSEGK